MSLPVKTILRFIVFIFFQVMVLDRILLFNLVTPYIYFLFILWLPFKMNRAVLMLVAFALGLTVDYFQHNPGFHAAACVLIAFLRPFLVSILVPQEGSEANYEAPSPRSFGGMLPCLLYTSPSPRD